MESLQASIQQAKPGDEIIMSIGVWRDVEIVFEAYGTKEKSITHRVEKGSQLNTKGKSYLKLPLIV